MAIGTPVQKATIDTGSSATSYTSASGVWTPTTTNLYVAFIGNGKATTPDTPTVTGNSLTWTNVGTILSGDSTRRLTAFVAEGTGGTSGNTTADFAGATQTSCRSGFYEVSGVDVSTVLTSPGAGKTICQAASGADAGVGSTATVTLAAAGNALNRIITGVLIKSAGTNIVPRTNWTEITELSQFLEVQWRSDAFETTSTATWTGNSRWAALSLEMRDASLAGVTGSGGITVAAASFAGTGTETITGTGAFAPAAASFSGTGTETITGSGGIAGAAASLSGTEAETFTGSGGITGAAASFAGVGTFGSTAPASGSGSNWQDFIDPNPPQPKLKPLPITGAGGFLAPSPTLRGRGEHSLENQDEEILLLLVP